MLKELVHLNQQQNPIIMLLKNVYDKLVAKVNNIRASGFLLRAKYDTDKSDLEKKSNCS